MENKSIMKFSLSTSKKRYSNSEWGRTNCQSITVNTPRADRHCKNCDKYLFSPDIRREPNVFNFVNIIQTNVPETIGNLAKFILHGLKLYT